MLPLPTSFSLIKKGMTVPLCWKSLMRLVTPFLNFSSFTFPNTTSWFFYHLLLLSPLWALLPSILVFHFWFLIILFLAFFAWFLSNLWFQFSPKPKLLLNLYLQVQHLSSGATFRTWNLATQVSNVYHDLDVSKINMSKTRVHNTQLQSPNVLLWFV